MRRGTLILMMVFGGIVSAQENVLIPNGSRILVAPMGGGLDKLLVAAISKNQVPLIMVSAKEQADFEASSEYGILLSAGEERFIFVPAPFESTKINIPKLTIVPLIAEAVTIKVTSCKTAEEAFSVQYVLGTFKRRPVPMRDGTGKIALLGEGAVDFSSCVQKRGKNIAESFARGLKVVIDKKANELVIHKLVTARLKG